MPATLPVFPRKPHYVSNESLCIPVVSVASSVPTSNQILSGGGGPSHLCRTPTTETNRFCEIGEGYERRNKEFIFGHICLSFLLDIRVKMLGRQKYLSGV